MQKYTKAELFESVPVPRALAAMGIPTIISQLINLIYNMVDAFFIGRTGNSYMMAATTVTLTLTMMNVAFSNLFGVGGGSLIARLMGVRREEDAKRVSAYSLRGCLLLSVCWSVVIGVFLEPILRVLGASANTLEFAKQYSILVIVIGSTPAILSLTLAHLLRNTGYSSQASFGLSLGGVLNIALDPLFMFVLLPRGQEVIGAALATLISNVVGCGYLLFAFVKAQKKAPLSLNLRLARGLDRGHVRSLYTVGVPSAMLTGLFDLASISVNILSAAHNDLVLAAMGIVMKVERVPNAINVGLCQGMLPIVAYNYSSGNHARMKQTIRTARLYGMVVSAVAIVLLEIFAKPVTNLFLSTSGKDAASLALPVHELPHLLLHAGDRRREGDPASRRGAGAGVLHPHHDPAGPDLRRKRPCRRPPRGRMSGRDLRALAPAPDLEPEAGIRPRGTRLTKRLHSMRAYAIVDWI